MRRVKFCRVCNFEVETRCLECPDCGYLLVENDYGNREMDVFSEDEEAILYDLEIEDALPETKT